MIITACAEKKGAKRRKLVEATGGIVVWTVTTPQLKGFAIYVNGEAQAVTVELSVAEARAVYAALGRRLSET